MKEYNIDAFVTESASQRIKTRRTELKEQHWNRTEAELLAKTEGIDLNDEHWAVIKYLRIYYVYGCMPGYAITLSRILKNRYASKGGSKYLYTLFTGGPVTQGSRLANIPLKPVHALTQKQFDLA